MIDHQSAGLLRFVARSGALLLLALGSAACDPCAGIADCRGDPQLLIQGRIVESGTGEPAPGVRVDVVRTDGAATQRDSTSAVTGAHGYYEAQLGSAGEANAEVTVAIRVTSADASYRVEGVTVRTTPQRGGVHALPAWVRRPWFAYTAEVWRKNDFRERTTGAAVIFQRTGGVELAGADWRSDGTYRSRTDHNGKFALLGRRVTARSLDEVVGELRIETATGWRLLAPHRMRPTHLYEPDPVVTVFRGGPYFPYFGVVHLGGEPVRGVDVTFRRVSGVTGVYDEFTEYSTARGEFNLGHFGPDTTGDVVFDLTFTSSPVGGPEMTPFTIRLTLPVRTENSFGELLGIFDVDRPEDPMRRVAAPAGVR